MASRSTSSWIWGPENRRCPPRVLTYGSLPSVAHRATVLGETCSRRATSPARRYSSRTTGPLPFGSGVIEPTPCSHDASCLAPPVQPIPGSLEPTPFFAAQMLTQRPCFRKHLDCGGADGSVSFVHVSTLVGEDGARRKMNKS